LSFQWSVLSFKKEEVKEAKEVKEIKEKKRRKLAAWGGIGEEV
jgi:hypothetical protein